MQFRLIQYHLEKLALNLYIIKVLFTNKIGFNAHDLEKSLKIIHIKSKLIVAGISCNINN